MEMKSILVMVIVLYVALIVNLYVFGGESETGYGVAIENSDAAPSCRADVIADQFPPGIFRCYCSASPFYIRCFVPGRGA
jgi:hypothetical protein